MLLKQLSITSAICATLTLASAASAETTVVFWHPFSGATGEAFQSIVDQYNSTLGAEKEVTVEAVFQGYEGTNKVILAYQTNDIKNAPDVNVGLTSTIPNVMELGWSVSAEQFLTADSDGLTKDSFFPAAARATTYKDEMVAIPYATSIPILYYNAEQFSEAGLDHAPATFDEMAQFTKTLTKSENGSVSRYGLNAQVNRYILTQLIVSQKPENFFFDNEGGRKDLPTRMIAGDDGSLENALNKLAALRDTGGYKCTEDDIKAEFAQGLSSMVIMSSSKLGTMDELMPNGYMTAYLPKVNADDTSGAAIGGSSLNIFDRDDEERLNATWDFIEYLLQPENQYTFSTASGYLPVTSDAAETDEMKAFFSDHPQFEVAVSQMRDTNPLAQEPMEMIYSDVNNIVSAEMLRFCSNETSVEETRDNISNQINAALEQYRADNQ